MVSHSIMKLLLFNLFNTGYTHVVMRLPPPFPGATSSPAPITADLFPCNLASNFEYTFPENSTSIAAGSSVLVDFVGSAVHGGGSCQFSLSSKSGSTDPADWKVIKTVIGGCPATVNGEGNLQQLDTVQIPGSATEGTFPDGLHCSAPGVNETDCVRGYEVQIPAGIPAGEYTFAWTWFNKIGNREMYMGCSPIRISSTQTNSTFTDSLPGLFVANIEGYCTTSENDDFVLPIPSPGLNVEVSNNIHDRFDDSILGACSNVTSNMPLNGGHGGTIPTPAAYFAYTKLPAAIASSSGTASSASTSSDGAGPASLVIVPVATTSPTSTNTVTIYETSSFATRASSGRPSSAPVPSSLPVSSALPESCAAGKIACPTGTAEGALVCVSYNQWALCKLGCMTPMDVAAGTSCHNGTIT